MVNVYPTGNEIKFSFKGTKFMIEEAKSKDGVITMYPFSVSKDCIKREVIDKYARDGHSDFFCKYMLQNEKFLDKYGDLPDEYYGSQKYLDDAFEAYPDYLDADFFSVDDLINPLKSVQVDALYNVYLDKLTKQINTKQGE